MKYVSFGYGQGILPFEYGQGILKGKTSAVREFQRLEVEGKKEDRHNR